LSGRAAPHRALPATPTCSSTNRSDICAAS
jgi:hypothetical protein